MLPATIALIPLLIFGMRNVLADGVKMNAGWWRALQMPVSGITNGALLPIIIMTLYVCTAVRPCRLYGNLSLRFHKELVSVAEKKRLLRALRCCSDIQKTIC